MWCLVCKPCGPAPQSSPSHGQLVTEFCDVVEGLRATVSGRFSDMVRYHLLCHLATHFLPGAYSHTAQTFVPFGQPNPVVYTRSPQVTRHLFLGSMSSLSEII